jgi:hypothetical protein
MRDQWGHEPAGLRTWTITPVLPGDPPQPCPELLTEEEAIRYLRLDIDGPKKPALTLRHYRERGLLRGTRVRKRVRYRRVELDRFMEKLTR